MTGVFLYCLATMKQKENVAQTQSSLRIREKEEVIYVVLETSIKLHDRRTSKAL